MDVDLIDVTVSPDEGNTGAMASGDLLFTVTEIPNAVSVEGGTAILRGNLAPDGCVIKQTAADPKFHRHQGGAVVFKDYVDLSARIDDPNLDVNENSVLILQNAGPIGAPGMPEWGMLPIPKKLLKKGVRDMVRISDCRMSGTAYGTCILHVSPEAAVGGPLALVQNGDMVELDIPNRTLNMEVSEEELTSTLQASIAASLNVHPSDVSVDIDADGVATYTISSATAEEADALQEVLQDASTNQAILNEASNAIPTISTVFQAYICETCVFDHSKKGAFAVIKSFLCILQWNTIKRFK